MWNDASVKPTEWGQYHTMMERDSSGYGSWGAVEFIQDRATYDPDDDLWDEPEGYTVVKWRE